MSTKSYKSKESRDTTPKQKPPGKRPPTKTEAAKRMVSMMRRSSGRSR